MAPCPGADGLRDIGAIIQKRLFIKSFMEIEISSLPSWTSLSIAAFATIRPSQSPITNLFNLVGILPLISSKTISLGSKGKSELKKFEKLYDRLGEDVKIFILLLLYLLKEFLFKNNMSLISPRFNIEAITVPS